MKSSHVLLSISPECVEFEFEGIPPKELKMRFKCPNCTCDNCKAARKDKEEEVEGNPKFEEEAGSERNSEDEVKSKPDLDDVVKKKPKLVEGTSTVDLESQVCMAHCSKHAVHKQTIYFVMQADLGHALFVVTCDVIKMNTIFFMNLFCLLYRSIVLTEREKCWRLQAVQMICVQIRQVLLH